MKTVIIYDSLYGSTKKLAETLAAALESEAPRLLGITEAKPVDLLGRQLVIIGSPTHGGRPTPKTQEFLDQISSGALEGIAVATFDTRLAADRQTWPLRLLMKVIGYAAPKMMATLVSKGAKKVIPPAGFIVETKQGGFLSGEEPRAAAWAKTIIEIMKSPL